MNRATEHSRQRSPKHGPEQKAVPQSHPITQGAVTEPISPETIIGPLFAMCRFGSTGKFLGCDGVYFIDSGSCVKPTVAASVVSQNYTYIWGPKRQRTAALQDASAPTYAPENAKRLGKVILIVRHHASRWEEISPIPGLFTLRSVSCRRSPMSEPASLPANQHCMAAIFSSAGVGPNRTTSRPGLLQPNRLPRPAHLQLSLEKDEVLRHRAILAPYRGRDETEHLKKAGHNHWPLPKPPQTLA